MKNSKSKMSCKRGFTLIELLIVVLIIGILAAVAVPQYQKAVTKSRFATLKNLVHSIAQAEELYYLENGSYTNNWADLSVSLEKNKVSEDVDCSLSVIAMTGGGSNAGVGCTLLIQKIQYSMQFTHSDWVPGQRRCTVSGTTDTTDWRNTICQAETGKQNGATVTSDGGYIFYLY